MRRTFISFNKDGRAEERLDGFFPAVEVSKTEFVARRQELNNGDDKIFVVDEDLILNFFLNSTSLTYDGKNNSIQGISNERIESNNILPVSLDLLRDDFGGRQTKEISYGNWDAKLPNLRGD